MKDYEYFFEIIRLIQQDRDPGQLANQILACLAGCTGATRGYVVAKQGDSYERQSRFGYEVSEKAEEKKFSRSLVRETLRTGRVILSRDLLEDPRFADAESKAWLQNCSVIAAPMGHGQDVYMVVYLERDQAQGPFCASAIGLVGQFLQVAGDAMFYAIQRTELARFQQDHAADFLASHDFKGIVGGDPAMVRLLRTVVQVARSDAAVLVLGETGSGKELIARAIYANSPRRRKPFAVVHCGALPETLFEAELFGHKRGAFTGANRDRPGRIAQAAGGTLFIDEVGEIPLVSQAKLLRFFQSGEFQRIGSDQVERVDVRIVAATHRNLKEMVAKGSFREDLYYRLNVLELEIPPLRDRPGDIALLTRHFLDKYWRYPKPAKMSTEVLQALDAYPYPGNVRELAHAIERAAVLADEPAIRLDHLPRNIQEHYRNSRQGQGMPDTPFSQFTRGELKKARERATAKAVTAVERRFLEGLLQRCQGNVAQAAKASGINRTYLYRLVAKHRLTQKT